MSRSLVKQGAAKLRKAHEDDPATTAPPAARTGEPASGNASGKASRNTSSIAGGNAGISASGKAGRKDSGNSERSRSSSSRRKPRRPGRPRGPERVPLSVRILRVNDDRLTEAVNITGQSPQYIVDAALAAYFDQLGIPRPDAPDAPHR